MKPFFFYETAKGEKIPICKDCDEYMNRIEKTNDVYRYKTWPDNCWKHTVDSTLEIIYVCPSCHEEYEDFRQ